MEKVRIRLQETCQLRFYWAHTKELLVDLTEQKQPRHPLALWGQVSDVPWLVRDTIMDSGVRTVIVIRNESI